MPNVIRSRQTHDEHGPDRQQEHHEQRRYREGIERGMIIKMPPHVGLEHLNAGIQRRRRGYDEAQQRGIKRVDVAEMHYPRLVLDEPAHPIGDGYERDNHQEHQQVSVREGGNKLRDGVVGHHAGQHLRFVNPPERVLVAGQLHPDGVYRVGGQHADVSHHHMTVTAQHQAVGHASGKQFFGLLLEQHERIALDDEIIVVGVMVLGIEMQRVCLCGVQGDEGL